MYFNINKIQIDYEKNEFSIFTIALVLLVVSCNQKKESFKVAYVNLQAVYAKQQDMLQADSIYKVEVEKINNYIANVDRKLKSSKYKKEVLQVMAKAYNDTVVAYKTSVEKKFNTVVNAKKNKIQTVIDSLAKKANYNYVLSTNNANILYVKDTLNNLTQKIITTLK